MPHFNVLNGGAHAQNPLEFQEFMIAPIGAATFAEAYRAGSEIYSALRARLHEFGHSTGLGDEGGFAPDIATPEEALDLLVAAIGAAGYDTGRAGVAIALDPASSGFRQADGTYTVAGDTLTHRSAHRPLRNPRRAVPDLVDRRRPRRRRLGRLADD